MVNLQEGYIWPKYMCILLYVKHIQCSGIPEIYGQLEEPLRGLDICAFCYMLKLLWCNSIQYIYGQLGGGYICPKYMCILLCVKHIQCSGIP